jgi:rhomboid protease GluP
MLREIRTFILIFGGILFAGVGLLGLCTRPTPAGAIAIAAGLVMVWFGRKVMNGEEAEVFENAQAQSIANGAARKTQTPYSKSDAELNRKLNREFIFCSGVMIALNLLVFYWFNVRQGFAVDAVSGEKALSWGADFAPLTGRGEIWRLFTAQFLHAEFTHFLGNMIALFIAGRYVEYYFGRASFFLIYFGGGLFGNLASNLILPTTISLGASGAVYSLYGALFSAMFVGHGKEGRVQLSRWAQYYIAFYTLKGLMAGFHHEGINNAAHLLGLVAGFAIAYFSFELRWDFPKMAGSVATALFGIIVGMQVGYYPKLPSMKSMQARMDSAKAMQEIALIAMDLEKQLRAIGEATQMLQAGQMSEADLVGRAWKMEIKPKLQLLRSRAYKVKVPDQKSYAIQTELYQAVAGYERYFTTLYEGSHQEAQRMIASIGPGKFPAKEHFENAIHQLEANIPRNKKR